WDKGWRTRGARQVCGLGRPVLFTSLNMNRATRTVLLGLLVVAAVAGLAYVCTMRLCARQMSADDLSWLRREFRLSEAEVQRVRGLHEGDLPQCRDMCAKISAKQEEVEKALEQG